MKKLFAIALALTMLLSLCACGAKEEAPAETPAEETPAEEPAPVGMPNPMKEADPETILNELGITMVVPQGAENLHYFIIDGETRIAELDFFLNGSDYTYRMAPSAFGEEKIDGMHYEWTKTEEFPVGYLTGTVSWIEGDAGMARWFDIVPGMLYTLSTSENVDPEALKTLANELFEPLQGDAEGDYPAGSFEENFTAALQRITTDCRPGTAGSTLMAAGCCAELCDVLTAFNPSAEEVKAVVESFLATLDPDQLSLFWMQKDSVIDQFSQITGENGAALLEDCGYVPMYGSWDVAAIEEIIRFVNDEGGEEVFASILADYASAKHDGWDREKLEEKGLNYMALDSSVGYLIKDIDGDGTLELLVGSMDEDNPFMRGMIFDLYTQDESGAPSLVFQAWERNRWYSLSETLFRHEGSSGAADSFGYVEQYLNGKTMILSDATGEVQPLALTPVE